jgi:hypothetical protein
MNKKLEQLAAQIKTKFMVMLRAESKDTVKKLGIEFIEAECPVLQLNRVKIDNP